MSDFSDIYDDEDETPTQQGGPKALRDAYEAEKAARRELEQRLEKLEAGNRQSTLADALKASGADPRIAGLIPKEVTPDKLPEWLGQWGEVFGLTKTEEATAPAVSTDDAAAIAAVSGDPTGTSSSATQHTAESIAGLDNEADFWKAVRGG